ncbi:hypothetical protein HMSSN036_87210 [Paenibacillus macerans]|nr:hypothetical protein HMSSN036_87210 [Paenibacillus macerans]
MRLKICPGLIKREGLVITLFKALKDNQSDTYQAVTGVLKASKYLLDSMKFSDGYNFVFPIILVEGELFECYLDNNNENKI